MYIALAFMSNKLVYIIGVCFFILVGSAIILHINQPEDMLDYLDCIPSVILMSFFCITWEYIIPLFIIGICVSAIFFIAYKISNTIKKRD